MKTFDRFSRFTGIALTALIGLLFFAGTSFATPTPTTPPRIRPTPRPRPGPIIVGHTGTFGVMVTYNFATGGTATASFVPGGAYRSGRGVQVIGNTVYYTGITGDIHLAPYNNGLGGPDFAVFPNPRQPGCPGYDCGVQDLAYHVGVLYALTGYYLGLPIVYGLNPTTGQVISRVPILRLPNSTQSDGFTVLPNGNFLINDGDFRATYREYYSTGTLAGTPTGFFFTVPFAEGTAGVDYNPADNSLYFSGLFCFSCPGYATKELVRTDLNGNLLGHVQISIPLNDGIEDISVPLCQVPRFSDCIP